MIITKELEDQIRTALDGGMKQREASRMFGVSLGSVNRISKTRQSVRAQYSTQLPKIRRKAPKYEAINDAVHRWYREQTETPGATAPTGTEIQQKAIEISSDFWDVIDVMGFCASNGWLYSWRKMYDVSAQASGSQAPTPLSMLDLRHPDTGFENDQSESAPTDTQEDPIEPPEVTETKLTNGDAATGEQTTAEILDALDLLEQVCKRLKGDISGRFMEFRTMLQAAMIDDEH